MGSKLCAHPRIRNKIATTQNQGGVDLVRKDQCVVARHEFLQSSHFHLGEDTPHRVPRIAQNDQAGAGLEARLDPIKIQRPPAGVGIAVEGRNFDDGVPQCRWDRQERHVGGSRDNDRGSWANQVLNHRLQCWKNRRSNPHRFRIQIPTKTLLLESGGRLGNCGGEPCRVVAQKPVLNRGNHDLLNARSGTEIHFSNPSTQNIAAIGRLNARPLQ